MVSDERNMKYSVIGSDNGKFVAMTMIIVRLIGHLRGIIGSALDHRPLPPEFETRLGRI